MFATMAISHLFSYMTSAVLLLLLACPVLTDWNQEYGDYMSSNYIKMIPSNNLFNVTGTWNYTNPGQYSVFYQAPAISEEGTVFIPFLKYPEYDLEVIAIASNGSLLWTSQYIVGYSEILCAAVLLTNAVYSSERRMVIIGWTCAAAFPYYRRHGGLVGLNSTTGEKMWRSPNLTDANDLSMISISSNVAYVSGGYDCWKDGSLLNTKLVGFRESIEDEDNNVSQIYAISLNNGNILWKLNRTSAGCTSQTKLYPLENGRHLIIFSIELPRTYYIGGKLLALECDSEGSCTQAWLSDVGVCYVSTFAFSSQGVLFGGTGFDGDPDTIFGLDVKTGKTIFKSIGYCGPGYYPSGPAVDKMGNAYYSCGNRVFVISSNGKLVWKTDIFKGSPGYLLNAAFRFPPAIVPYKNSTLLIVVNTNSTHLFSLAASNGSIINSYKLSVFNTTQHDEGLFQPPFVASNRVFWIRHTFLKYYLFSTDIDYLLNNND